MKNLTKTIIALTAAAILGVASGIEASAKDSDYTREELIDLLWTDYWSDSLPGEENPEGSLEYYILECFLDENYGVVDYHVVSDWSSYYLITSAWEDYHDEFTQYWDYEDDDETNEFTIRSYDPETDEYGDTLYTFEYIDGMWNMIDTNGNTYLTFEPHGGDGSYAALKEQEDNSSFDFSGMTNTYVYDPETGGKVLKEDNNSTDNSSTETATSGVTADESAVATESSEENRTRTLDEETSTSDGEASDSASNSASSSNSNRVTGTTANSQIESEETSLEDSSETDEEDENASLPIPLIIAGIIIVGGGAGAIIYSKKKKNGGKKK